MSEGRSHRGQAPAQAGRSQPEATHTRNVSSNTLLAETTRHCDQAAFADLFRSHYGRVYRVLYRLVGDEADDLAQEVFLRLYGRLPRMLGADVDAWLYRVATRLGYNALRAARRRERHLDTLGHAPDGDGWQGTTPDPEAWSELRDTQQRVRQALGELAGRQARLLTLRSSGLSYREIAAALQVAPGSVGTLLARAERGFERAYRSLPGSAAETGDEP